MFKKVISPSQYLYITMRENNYLIAGLLLVIILLTFYSNQVLEPKINNNKWLSFGFHTFKYAIIIIFVFTFLRPISQFIYFQF